jgi:hypothetical protein
MDWALAYRPCDLPGGRGRSVGQPVLRSQFAEFANVVAARRIRFPMVPGGYFHLGIDEAPPGAGAVRHRGSPSSSTPVLSASTWVSR